MRMIKCVTIPSFSSKNDEKKPEHVKSRQKSSEDRGIIKNFVMPNGAVMNRV
jgi:hypothetical protein